MKRINLAVGWEADGESVPLYFGEDAQAAKDAYTEAINGGVPGLVKAACYLKLRPDRRHDVVNPQPEPPQDTGNEGGEGEVRTSEPELPISEGNTAVACTVENVRVQDPSEPAIVVEGNEVRIDGQNLAPAIVETEFAESPEAEVVPVKNVAAAEPEPEAQPEPKKASKPKRSNAKAK